MLHQVNAILLMISGILFLSHSAPASGKELVERPVCNRQAFGEIVGNDALLDLINQNSDDLVTEVDIVGRFLRARVVDQTPELSIQIGPRKKDRTTVVYSRYAHPLPKFQKGEVLRVCGRYVGRNGRSAIYQTHLDWSPRPGGADGFIYARGKKYE